MSDATHSCEEFAGFFDNVRQGRLAFPRCEACAQFHWYPMPRCPHCQSHRIAWSPVSGRGEIFSLTEVRHAFDKSRRESLPYIVALLTFPDAPGVRLITNIVRAEYAGLRIGDPVEAIYPADASVSPIVLFTPARRARGEAT